MGFFGYCFYLSGRPCLLLRLCKGRGWSFAAFEVEGAVGFGFDCSRLLREDLMDLHCCLDSEADESCFDLLIRD